MGARLARGGKGGLAGRSVIPLGVPHSAPRLPQQVASDVSDFYTNMYAAFYRDLGAYWALLGNAVNWSQAFWSHGNMGPTAPGRAPQRLSIYVLSGPNPWIPPYSASPESLRSPQSASCMGDRNIWGCSFQGWAGVGSAEHNLFPKGWGQ